MAEISKTLLSSEILFDLFRVNCFGRLIFRPLPRVPRVRFFWRSVETSVSILNYYWFLKVVSRQIRFSWQASGRHHIDHSLQPIEKQPENRLPLQC